jgi:hypothetical protein
VKWIQNNSECCDISRQELNVKLELLHMNRLNIFSLGLALVLVGCGTTEVVKRSDSNFSVSSQYGSMNGSWSRASSEAVGKAEQYCSALGLKYIFVGEKRDGVLGWSPQVSEITFQCGQDTNALLKADHDQCIKEMQVNELNVIRDKIEMLRETEAAVPFTIASNENYPSKEEKNAISAWAKLREDCVSRSFAIISKANRPQNQLQINYAEQDLSFSKKLSASISELIVVLYQQKITYAEFAQKRLEIGRNINAAQRDFRAAVLIADREMQSKAQQLAEQQMQNNLIAWSSYMQSVNARQPLRANCITQKIGNTVTTNCN